MVKEPSGYDPLQLYYSGINFFSHIKTECLFIFCILQQLITSRSEVEEYKKKLEQEKINRKIDKQLDREKWDREQTEKRDKDNSDSQVMVNP